MTDDSHDIGAATSGTDGSTGDEPTGERTGGAQPTDRAADAGTGRRADDGRAASRDLVTYVEWAAFAVLALLAAVATFRFYSAVSNAIEIWFSADFVPIFQAAFNLLVLLLAALGISVLVRRLQ